MHFSAQEKAMWLQDWRNSGKSAWAYAKENGHVPQTFIRWTKAAAESPQPFVEVPAPIMRPLQQTPEILIEKGDIKIHLPLSLSSSALHAVMEGLKAVL